MSTTTLEAGSTLRIIDADTHYTEPHDLWTSRAPASLRARVPQVKVHNGEKAWVIDGDKLIGFGANPASVIMKDGSKLNSMHSFLATQIEDVHPSSYDMKARVAMMDSQGIYAQVAYPNIMGFGGSRASDIDPQLRLATIQMYNDAVAEAQAESGDRFIPMCIIPWWDMKAALAEIERAAELGLRGVAMGSDPQEQKDSNGGQLPDLGDPHWNPLWEVCESLNFPINFHVGANDSSMLWIGDLGWPSMADNLKAALQQPMLSMQNGRVVGNIICSGLLDRYTKLTFVSVESGIGWIPFLLECMEFQFHETASEFKFDLTPAEYFRRNFLGSFWLENRNLANDIRAVGVDSVMFQTDFPHPTCLYPVGDVEGRVSELTAEERAKVLSLNAARVYNIPLS